MGGKQEKVVKIHCTGSHMVALEEMHDFQGNLKTLTKEDAQRMKNRIIKKGFRYPFFLWKDKAGKIWINDGHQRHRVLPMLAKEGWKIPDKYPSDFIDAEDEKEAAELILDQSNTIGRMDEEGLHDFIYSKGLEDQWNENKVDWEFAGIDKIEFDQGWMQDGDFIEGGGEDDFDVDKAVAEIEKPITRPGDLWLLGKCNHTFEAPIQFKHRLLCGDATKREDVERLMGGKKADMVFTDPPYNLAYKSGTWSGKRKEKMKELKNDKMDDSNFIDFLKNSFVNLYNNVNDNIDTYICTDWKVYHLFRTALIELKKELSNLIVWNKEYQTQALNKYANAHEFILFLGDNKYPYKDINVWNCKRVFDPDHPTPKPIEIITKAIKYSGNKKESLILDLFIGSGSTLIACEQTNRVCFGMDIEPLYCDVTIKRWEAFSGQEAVREDGKKFKELVEK